RWVYHNATKSRECWVHVRWRMFLWSWSECEQWNCSFHANRILYWKSVNVVIIAPSAEDTRPIGSGFRTAGPDLGGAFGGYAAAREAQVDPSLGFVVLRADNQL